MTDRLHRLTALLAQRAPIGRHALDDRCLDEATAVVGLYGDRAALLVLQLEGMRRRIPSSCRTS
ncbi:hypothetical protein, partial [Xanthomonas fragariae]|uniref:hypothetical protein n=1 Tax=Xanthomonas fragariae TaxID=48664 RepID=UPI001F482CB3